MCGCKIDWLNAFYSRLTNNKNYCFYVVILIPKMDDEILNDEFKVYVSRLPEKWNNELLVEHFQSCFGKVVEGTVIWDKENDCSRGFGYVTFENQSSRDAAIAQGSIHAKRKIIQIKPVSREQILGRGRDNGICYLWAKNACVKGDLCKFLHEGPGSCISVSAPGQGKRKCLSFKTKGKCGKGDQCPFRHERNQDPIVEKSKSIDKIKICHKFKKGKCKHGDSCLFSHDISFSKKQKSHADQKRKRIDGGELVKKRKTLPQVDVDIV